jgi:hypothetical protein
VVFEDGSMRALFMAREITREQVAFIKQVIVAATGGGDWRPADSEGDPPRWPRIVRGVLIGPVVTVGLSLLWVPLYPLTVHRPAYLGGMTAARQCDKVREVMGADLTWTFGNLYARSIGGPAAPVNVRVKGKRGRGLGHLSIDYGEGPSGERGLTLVELRWGRGDRHVDVLKCLRQQELLRAHPPPR